MSNFELCLSNVSSSINLVFLKSIECIKIFRYNAIVHSTFVIMLRNDGRTPLHETERVKEKSFC